MSKSLDQLRSEVEDLHASRKRLVLAADDDRRRIERELHDGPQQQLVALAVNLQLARRLLNDDTAAGADLLDQIGRDVQDALNETRRLADRIYPPLLDTGGLGVALRATAAILGVPTNVEVSAGARLPSVVASSVYFCCVEALERAGDRASVTVSIREADEALTFEIIGSDVTHADLARERERVESLDGRLTIASKPGHGTRVFGRLPLCR